MGESPYDEETHDNLREASNAAGRITSAEERAAVLAKLLFPSEKEQVIEMLSLIRRIVSSGWDKEWASDEQGNQVEEWSDRAVHFNLIAAKLKAWYLVEDVVDFMVHSKASRLVDAVIDEQVGATEVDYYAWQTAPERTKEDVLVVIGKALEKAKVGPHGHQP